MNAPALPRVKIRAFQVDDEEAVIALWRRCDLVRPWNDPRQDILRKSRVRPDLFLVGLVDGEVVASIMAGYEGHRGWLNYLAVDPGFRQQGIGRAIVQEVEQLLNAEGCPKINLQIRPTNREVIAFYQKLGYVVEESVSMGKRLQCDDSPTEESNPAQLAAASS